MGTARIIFTLFIFLLLCANIVYCQEKWPYQLYRSNLHVHTFYSEKARHLGSLGKIRGVSSPLENFDHELASPLPETCRIAENIGLDGIGISDHDCALTGSDWQEIIKTSRKFTNNKFFVLSGFEWTPGDYNHVNVFGTSSFISANAKFLTYGIIGIDKNIVKAPDWASFTAWIKNQTAENPNLVCQFNHPDDAEGHFRNFVMSENEKILSEVFALIEIRSGPAIRYTSINTNERYFQMAIQNGWWVAPTIGIDNFGNLTKGGARKCHTAIWAEKNSDNVRENILSALLQRKTYASEDDNFVLKFSAKVEDDNCQYYLGDRIDLNRGQKVLLKVELVDPDESIGELELVTINKNGISVSDFDSKNAVISSSKYSFVIGKNPSDLTLAYYLKIIQKDGNIIVTAPIGVNVTVPKVQNYNEHKPDPNNILDVLYHMDDFKFKIILCNSYKKGCYGGLESYSEKNVFYSGRDKIYMIIDYSGLDKIYDYPCIVKTILYDPHGKIIKVNKIIVNKENEEKGLWSLGTNQLTIPGIYTIEGYVNNDLRDRRTFKLIK